MVILVAVSLRVILLPLQIYATKKTIRQQNILPKYMELQKDLKRASARNDILEGTVTLSHACIQHYLSQVIVKLTLTDVYAASQYRYCRSELY